VLVGMVMRMLENRSPMGHILYQYMRLMQAGMLVIVLGLLLYVNRLSRLLHRKLQPVVQRGEDMNRPMEALLLVRMSYISMIQIAYINQLTLVPHFHQMGVRLVARI